MMGQPATTFMKTDSEKVYVAEFMDAVSISFYCMVETRLKLLG
jgi:hypothetical protein